MLILQRKLAKRNRVFSMYELTFILRASQAVRTDPGLSQFTRVCPSVPTKHVRDAKTSRFRNLSQSGQTLTKMLKFRFAAISTHSSNILTKTCCTIVILLKWKRRNIKYNTNVTSNMTLTVCWLGYYFGTNLKRVSDFLLMINSNLGPILFRFRDIAGFLLKTAPHPYSTRILEMFPLDWIGDVGAPKSDDPKQIIRVITFDVT